MHLFDKIYLIHKLKYHNRICDLNILNRHSGIMLLHQLKTSIFQISSCDKNDFKIHRSDYCCLL